MSFNSVSNPSVLINNKGYIYVPNSFTTNLGLPEINVRSGVIGGGATESVHSVNPEAATSTVKFSLYVTAGIEDDLIEWKNLQGQIAIRFAENAAGASGSYTGLSLVNSPDITYSADGVVEVEFKGDSKHKV